MVPASRMVHRIGPLAILALAALVVWGVAAGQGKQQKQQKQQKPQQPQQPQQQQPQQQQQQQQQIAQALSKVDRKLLSYATADARNELKPVQSEADAGVLVALGRILEQEKKLDEAATKFREAAKAAPGDPAPWVYLGEAYRRQKRDGDAKSAFKEAEKRAGGDAQDAMAHYYLGVAQQGLGQYEAAMASLGKARKLDPGNPLPVYQLGVTRALEQKHWQEAVDLLTEAIDMNPGIAYAYFYRGQAASQVKRNDLLIADLERFIKLAPDAPEAAIAARIVASVRR